MTSIDEIQARIREVRSLLEPLEAELQELRTAYRVLLRLAGEAVQQPTLFSGKVEAGDVPDLSNAKMTDAAEAVILHFGNKPRHYRDICKLAMQWGFVGRRTGEHVSEESRANSFRRMMGQEPERFSPCGKGLYQIQPAWLEHAPS